MNSGELKVDVPLASMESDCEEANTDSVANTPSKNAASRGKILITYSLGVLYI